jgi:hypothetical protein
MFSGYNGALLKSPKQQPGTTKILMQVGLVPDAINPLSTHLSILSIDRLNDKTYSALSNGSSLIMWAFKSAINKLNSAK